MYTCSQSPLAELNEERVRVGLGYRKGVVRTE